MAQAPDFAPRREEPLFGRLAIVGIGLIGSSIAHAARQLKGHGLTEGISTRLLVYAALLIRQGVSPADACRMALVRPITDDADIRQTLDHAIAAILA